MALDESTALDTPPPAVLKVGTFNLWHSLDPVGTWRFRECETEAQQEKRLALFLAEARKAALDVWFLQEANPAPEKARRLADALGMDEVHQVDNCGIRLGFGIPTNLRSGLVILARKGLDLARVGGVKLSGGPGFCADRFGFQTAEFRYALVAEIRFSGERVLLANVHLHHGPEVDAVLVADLERLIVEGAINRSEAETIRGRIAGATKRRLGELDALFRFLDTQGGNEAPTILAGDLNASPDSRELASLLGERGFVSSTGPWDPNVGPYTWDFERNPLTHFALDFTLPVRLDQPRVAETLRRTFARTRRLDYVLLRHPHGYWHVKSSELFGQVPDATGLYPSDHFGLQATIVVTTQKGRAGN